MGHSLDAATMIGELLELLVPRFADLAAVGLADGSIPLSWRAVDEAGAVADGVVPDALRAPVEGAIRRAMIDGRRELLPVGERCPQGLVLPLVARGRTVGALAAAMTSSARRYADADLELFPLVAARIALALDNGRLYREIQERDRQKDEFLAMLSHELRNPLGAITTATHLLQTVPLTDGRAVKARDVLLRQSSHLARIVDDLLDVAQVTTGRVTLHRSAMDLRELVEQAIETLRVSGRLDRHRLEIRLQSVVADVDAERTAQIVTNILVNALKYTDPGGCIEVDLSADDTHAVLSIQDTGIGMTADMIGRLFQPFSQEYQALDRSRGGLGLGLTLVRRLVELQDGFVEARSEGPGMGSAFTVRLPRALRAAPRPAAVPRDLSSAGELRILLVEDNADAREMLRTLLDMAGHETYEAGDGLEALARAREVKPQVALVDLGLPGIDGLELASRIRSLPQGDGMVLVALTGYGQPHDRQRTRDAGFDFHVVKPVASDVLRDVLALAAARVGARTVAP